MAVGYCGEGLGCGLVVMEGDRVELSYKKLWVKLVELDMKKTKFGKSVNITTDVLVKICEVSQV